MSPIKSKAFTNKKQMFAAYEVKTEATTKQNQNVTFCIYCTNKRGQKNNDFTKT